MLTNILRTLDITKRHFFPTQLPSQRLINMVKVVWFRFQKCLVPLPCCFPKGLLKGDFLEICLAILFGIRNFGNTSVTRVFFFFENVQNLT